MPTANICCAGDGYGPSRDEDLAEQAAFNAKECLFAYEDHQGYGHHSCEYVVQDGAGFWHGECGGCSCGGSWSSDGPYATFEEALSHVPEYNRRATAAEYAQGYGPT